MKTTILRKMKGLRIAAFAIFSFFMFALGLVVAIPYISPPIEMESDPGMQQTQETALNEKERSLDQS